MNHNAAIKLLMTTGRKTSKGWNNCEGPSLEDVEKMRTDDATAMVARRASPPHIRFDKLGCSLRELQRPSWTAGVTDPERINLNISAT